MEEEFANIAAARSSAEDTDSVEDRTSVIVGVGSAKHLEDLAEEDADITASPPSSHHPPPPLSSSSAAASSIMEAILAQKMAQERARRERSYPIKQMTCNRMQSATSNEISH